MKSKKKTSQTLMNTKELTTGGDTALPMAAELPLSTGTTDAVKLVWVTPEPGNVISYCARVSNPSNQESFATAPKLLKYCFDHKHYSIFEMASMCVEINTTRAISAQILRHRSFSFQEFSQRYADSSQLGIETIVPRKQDLKNRQNSTSDLTPEAEHFFNGAQRHIQRLSLDYYQAALDRGIAKESARFLLPMATKTRLYMAGSVRSWIHYVLVRTDPSTQAEHREIAEQCKKILLDTVPELQALLA